MVNSNSALELSPSLPVASLCIYQRTVIWDGYSC